MHQALRRRRRGISLALLLFLVVLASLGASSAGGSETQTPKKGGTIVIGVDAETPGWDPPDGLIGLSGRIVMGALYDSLTVPTADGGFREYLAEKVTTNGKKVWTIKLRRGIKYQDGSDFNAFTVERHMNRVINPKAAVGPGFSYVKLVKALNRYTVQIVLNQPRADFRLALSGGLGEVVSTKAVKARGKDFRTAPVGAGPYRMVRWVRDSEAVLESWSGYWRKDQPYAKRIVIRPIPDEPARAAAMRAGDLDLMFTQSPSDIKSFRGNNRFKLVELQFGTTGLYLHTQKPPLDDVRVRRAISYALNRQELINAVWNGIGQPTNSEFVKGSFWANAKAAKRWDNFNLAEATRLVGEYERDTGKKVAFSLISRVSQTEQNYKQALQAQLARAGMQVTLEQVTDDNTYVTRLINGNYTAATRLHQGFLDPIFEITRLHAKTSFLNIERFSTPELEKSINIGLRSNDRAKRKAAYDRIQEILKENAVGIYVRTNTVGLVMKPQIMGVRDWKFPDGTRGPGHEYITLINVDSLWRSDS